MTKLKICKHGNSLGTNLPKSVIEEMKVHEGNYIYPTKIDTGIQLSPYDDDLIKQMIVAEEIMREDREVLKLLADS